MFVGMDRHKNYAAVMNEKGKVLENSSIKNNLKQVGRFFDQHINNEKVRVVMESSSVGITHTVICLKKCILM